MVPYTIPVTTLRPSCNAVSDPGRPCVRPFGCQAPHHSAGEQAVESPHPCCKLHQCLAVLAAGRRSALLPAPHGVAVDPEATGQLRPRQAGLLPEPLEPMRKGIGSPKASLSFRLFAPSPDRQHQPFGQLPAAVRHKHIFAEQLGQAAGHTRRQPHEQEHRLAAGVGPSAPAMDLPGIDPIDPAIRSQERPLSCAGKSGVSRASPSTCGVPVAELVIAVLHREQVLELADLQRRLNAGEGLSEPLTASLLPPSGRGLRPRPS